MKIVKAKLKKKKSNSKKKPSLIAILPSKIVIYTFGFALVFAIISSMTAKNQPFCANSSSCIKDLSGEYDPQAKEGTYMGKIVSIPSQAFLAESGMSPSVLGASTGDKKIYVDLTHQRVYAFQGNTLIYNFIAATGKYYPTPTGDFDIWIKLQATLMAGGNPSLGTHYYLPNVPYTMYFYNAQYPKSRGYGVHGAYWLREDQFGSPQSHGCVNLHIEDAHKLYDWADPTTTVFTTYATADHPGTHITIYGKTPGI